MDETATSLQNKEFAKRKILKYNFFKVDREWKVLQSEKKKEAIAEFIQIVERHLSSIQMKFYSLVGIRADADFMVWIIADEIEDIQKFYSELNRSILGKYLETTYAYTAMSRRSRYIAGHTHENQEGVSETRLQGNSKYLFVYPFVKKREWYKLPYKERLRMMAEHFKIGHKYPSVKINTGYSFGLDDQEFVLAFESDSLADFLDLVEELRESDASAYTLRDTPSFTCLATEPEQLLMMLG
ncbi:MAG: chlorite dismutase family protein [Nitrososphaerota archaeon]